MDNVRGAYSVVKGTKDMYFVSGQLPQVDSTQDMEGLSFHEQAVSALSSLKKVLDENHVGWDQVLKVNIFVTDLGNYDAFNRIYLDTIHEDAMMPARTMVEVSRLPKNAQIEIEAVFCK